MTTLWDQSCVMGCRHPFGSFSPTGFIIKQDGIGWIIRRAARLTCNNCDTLINSSDASRRSSRTSIEFEFEYDFYYGANMPAPPDEDE